MGYRKGPDPAGCWRGFKVAITWPRRAATRYRTAFGTIRFRDPGGELELGSSVITPGKRIAVITPTLFATDDVRVWGLCEARNPGRVMAGRYKVPATLIVTGVVAKTGAREQLATIRT